MPAYRLVVDPVKRRLYAATSSQTNLTVNVLGDVDHATGDLVAYDLDAILRSPSVQTKDQPILGHEQRLELNAYVNQLTLSPDGQHLYYLAELLHDSHIGRIDTQKWSCDRELFLRTGGALSIALAPDASVLYALAGARLFALDTRTWKRTVTLTVGSSMHSLLAGKDGLIFLMERRFGVHIHIHVLNMHPEPRQRVLARWHIELQGRPYVCLTQDKGRLYLGTSAVLSGQILAVDVTNPRVKVPPVVGHTVSDHQRLIRGALFISDDGELVITGGGEVFRTAS